MVYTSIKTKLKNINWYNYLFYVVVIINSLAYLFIDFKNGDVEPNVRFYGTVQLIALLLVVFTIETAAGIKNKILRFIINFMFGFSFIMLMLIQIVPAALWIGFHGQVVAETPFAGNGVMGHWIYGAYHLFIIAWGIYIAIRRAGKFNEEGNI